MLHLIFSAGIVYLVLTFLTDDPRWENLRSYLYSRFDSNPDFPRLTTFLFGLIIVFVCPELFRLQNLFLGLVVSNRPFGLATLKHVLKSTTHQLLAIHNFSLFDSPNGKSIGLTKRSLKLAAGYLVYLIPTGAFAFVLLFANTDKTVCREMKAPFLLNNNFSPITDLENMYQERREFSWKRTAR